MNTTFIYALCEPGTRTVKYIGKTSKTAQKRLARHLKESIKLDTHLGFWLRKVVSCGEVPNLIVLREVPGDGSDAEIRCIRICRRLGIRLVNSTDGGEGVTMTPEIRKKIGEKNRGKPNVMKGRSRPLEVGAAVSASKMGHEVSIATRKQISETLKGQKLHHPQEWCDAMSRRMSGEKHPQFGKRGAESPNFGKVCSPETKANISAGRLAGIARRKQRDQEIEWALAPYTLE